LLLSKDTAEHLVAELTADENWDGPRAREAVEDLTRRAGQLADELQEAIRAEVDRALDAAGYVRRAEFERLEARLAAVEAAQRGETPDLPFESGSDM